MSEVLDLQGEGLQITETGFSTEARKARRPKDYLHRPSELHRRGDVS
jgi:hypothetical protein